MASADDTSRRSSTNAARSLSLCAAAAMSGVTALRSRVRSDCTARRRICALGLGERTSRASALCRVAISGCTLPMSCACCCARRKAASMSTTRFSSRERDRLCMSSSSWLRCKATSLRRASSKAAREAVSWASASDWRATARASCDWVCASVLWRASCSCMLLTFCHNKTVASSATAPNSPIPSAVPPDTPLAVGAAGAIPAGPVSGTGWETPS
ncbi:hypothetical protein GALL_504770 [mine drainage metagenome]|uniref:Uncharacterized protein n=1 Tax=mine drainage metagenome TaxID=410659 RepID=A0A1J5P9I5_9ZZZZ